MNRSRPNRLKFGCPRCMTRLEAKISQAGMRQRCPVCYWQFTVPTAERIAETTRRSRSEYGLSQDGRQALPDSAAYQTYIAVICRVCGTRMYATPDQVGHEMTCPDCDARTMVVPPAPSPAASTPGAAVAPVDEEYAVYQGEGQPPPDSREVYQAYVPVVCSLCRTRMLATLDQVGQEMICPDCETPNVVPPPHPKLPEGPVIPSNPREQYAVGLWNWWETGESGPVDSGEVLAVCPVCRTRLHVPPERVGHAVRCPDCGRSFDASTSKAGIAAPEPLEEIAEEYAVAAPVDRAELKPAVVPEEEAAESSIAEQAKAPPPPEEEELPEKPPRRPFLTGVFSFPFYPGSILYWMVLSVGAILIAALLREAYLLTQSSPMAWVLSILYGVLAALLGVVWVMIASAIGLAIVQDTSDGCDAIVNWPQGTIFDWFSDFLFVLNSVSLSLAVGLGLRSLVGADARLTTIILLATAFVAFPIFFVSMLEAGSPWRPFSAPIWWSVLSVGWGWGLFYLETALLGAVLVVPAVLLSVATHPLVGVPAIAAIVAALMIYFRLLGRLIWYCAQRLPDKEEIGKED
ncbi:MAG: hypothetical protein HUU20_04725 [Pirellulales bacterium]|nr:hypothetical protein [Pirellulales bacterium]